MMKRMNFAPLVDEMVSNDERVEERIQNKLVWGKVQSALKELSEDQQQVLALRFGFGMRIREVAQTLDKSEGSVKMLQVRAITNLQNQMNRANAAVVSTSSYDDDGYVEHETYEGHDKNKEHKNDDK